MKYIVYDLDDTLLNDQRKVSEFTLKVLKHLQDSGHKLVINTARSKYYSQEFLDAIQPDYAILNGGALIINKAGETIFSQTIDVPTVQRIIARLKEVTKVFSVQSESGFYSSDTNYTAQNAIYFDFWKDTYREPAYKIVTSIADDAKAESIAKEFDLDMVSYFGGDFKRFTHNKTNKASGNRNLMKLLRANMADVIAFGDDWGDLQMLQEAGLGVIMKNAREELRSLCPIISSYTNNEDGVARFLLEYFQICEPSI